MSKHIHIQTEKLNKVYPNSYHALKDVSIEVEKGEFLVVIGLSGSGKSTLLRCLNHLHDSSSGKIHFNGTDITHPPKSNIREIRAKIAMIFQQFNLIPRHTVLRNVLTGSLSRTSTFKSILGFFSKDDISKAKAMLEIVGIHEKVSRRADELSGGQQQRVAIARALMQNPEILLADEPVASLDPATCHTVMDHLKKINQELGITVICNLHFLSLVRLYADRVIALRAGEKVYDGSPTEINDAWFSQIYGEQAKEVHVN